MWRRFRRRSMAPSRPVIFPEQLGLVLLCIGAVGLGVWVALQLWVD